MGIFKRYCKVNYFLITLIACRYVFVVVIKIYVPKYSISSKQNCDFYVVSIYSDYKFIMK